MINYCDRCITRFSNIDMLFALFIYNIGVLTVNIEFMWQDLETGERRAFSESFQPFRAEPHTLILYLSCNTICKKKCYLI
jgi:hypothetical protein